MLTALNHYRYLNAQGIRPEKIALCRKCDHIHIIYYERLMGLCISHLEFLIIKLSVTYFVYKCQTK